MLVQISSSK